MDPNSNSPIKTEWFGKGDQVNLNEQQENEVDITKFEKLEKPLQKSDILTKPNANNIDDIIRIINHGKSPSASSSIFGNLIEPGKIGIIKHNGKIEAVGPGRYILFNPRASLETIFSLSENHNNFETLHIIRVQKGEVGFATDNGRPIILDEGIHVRNSRLFHFDKFESINQQYLNHGNIHIIRVPQGYYGLVIENTKPKILLEGEHITKSKYLTFNGMQLINQPYIQHGTLHILRIPKGHIALVNNNNKPQLLEGTHTIDSTAFTFYEIVNLNQEVIKHGTITRFRVRKGEIGLAWENNEPVFFDEGIYYKDSSNFIFEKCVNISEKQISLGSRKIITVFDGEVGVSYKKGKLVVLRPDRHLIESTEHIFQGFLSTQQQCIHLSNQKGSHGDLLFCETKDFVEIGLKADVFFQIVDPEKVLLTVGPKGISKLVKETSIATLNGIIRSTSLAEVAQNKDFAARSQKSEQLNPQSPSAPLFFDKVHDEFISRLHDHFVEDYGISILNIRIESFRISNTQLAKNISEQAYTTAQTQTQLANLAGETEIAVAQEKREAEVARIEAQGEAVKLQTETDAKNRSVLETAKTEADATVVKAKAEAQAVELRAEAEAKAILLKAEAEGKRAELLSKGSFGGQMAMLHLYSDMLKSSMKGVEKIVYVPSDMNGNNSLNFLAMPQILNNLTKK
jgi:regulator of protease activity HflC (stomatin/prohibitin superfamily)